MHAELFLSPDVVHTVGSQMDLNKYSPSPYIMQAKYDCSVVGPDNPMSSHDDSKAEHPGTGT